MEAGPYPQEMEPLYLAHAQFLLLLLHLEQPGTSREEP